MYVCMLCNRVIIHVTEIDCEREIGLGIDAGGR